MDKKKQNMGWDFLFSDNCEYDKNDDGSEGYKYSDGSGYYNGADGSEGYKYSDGSGYFKGADGSEGYRYSDGSGYYNGADGSEGYIYSDGSGYYNGVDGTSLSFEAKSNEDEDEEDNEQTSSANWAELGATVIGTAAAAYQAKMEAERKSNRSNRHKSSSKDNRSLTIGLIALGLACMIPLIVLLKFEIDKRIALRNGMVNAGFYRDLVGEDYEYVVSHFEAAGFTNIELVDLDDSGILFWREDKVDNISVGGNTSFESIDWFDPETKVIISYH